MPFTSRAILLGVAAFLIAASPALGAEATVAAVSLAGGTLVIVGLALIAIGAYALARPRSAGSSEDPPSQTTAESAATLVRPATPARPRTSAAGQQALAYRGATMGAKPSGDEGVAHPEPAYSRAGGSLLSAAESEDVQRFLAHASPIAPGDSMLSDRAAIVEQMLDALKAEQARRGR